MQNNSTTLTQNDKIQIQQIYHQETKQINITDIPKLWHQNKLHENIKFNTQTINQIIHTISKQSYQQWLLKQKQQLRNINTLVKIQLIQNIQHQYIKNPDKLQNSVSDANKKLEKIDKKNIDVTVLKEILKQPQQGHLYYRYCLRKKKDGEGINIYNKEVKSQQKNNISNQNVDRLHQNKQKKQQKYTQPVKDINKQKNQIQKVQAQKKQKTQHNKQNNTDKSTKTQQKIIVHHQKQQIVNAQTVKNHDEKQKTQQKQVVGQKQKSKQIDSTNLNKDKPDQNQNQKVQNNAHYQNNKRQQNTVKALETNHNVDIQQIMFAFYQKQQIQSHQYIVIKQKMQCQCTKELLKQFKTNLTQHGEQKKKKFTSNNYKIWYQQIKHHKVEQHQNIVKKQQIKKQQPKKQTIQIKKQLNQQKSQTQDKIKANKQDKHDDLKNNKSNNKLHHLVQKYFKIPKNVQIKQYNSSNLNLNFVHEPAHQAQTQLKLQVRIQVGQKYISKLQAHFQQNKIMNSLTDNKQFILLEIKTKKSEQLEQKVQSLIKQQKLKIQGVQIKTFTQTDKLYISLGYINENANSFLNSIYHIFTTQKQQQKQNYAKVQVKSIVHLQNQGKIGLENRKIAQCIAHGLQFNVKVQGNSQIVSRFRKNMEIQNKQSMFYLLLSISKNSSLKFKWKKIQDVNNFFSKLGILEVIKQTPTIKQFVNDGFCQIFQTGSPTTLKINKILTLILSQIQTNQIQLKRLNKNICLTFTISQNKSIKNLITS